MFCTNCGKKIPDGSRFCPECGAKLNVTSASSDQSPKINESNQRPVGTSVSIGEYSKWIITGSVVLMLIGLFLPVAKVSMFGISESAHLSDFELSDTGDLVSVIFLILSIIAGVISLIAEFKPNLKKYSKFTSIGSFVSALIYYLTIKNQIRDYGGIAKIGSGTILILIGSIVLLVFGILDLVQKKQY